MDNGDYIASIISKFGVNHVFTLCGGHIAPILVGCKKRGINVIDLRNEANVVFAADAYFRLTGRPGIAIVTAGPGVTNSITAIKNAQLAQSGLILIGGAAATILKGKGALQDMDQISIMESITKYCDRITKNCNIEEIFEKAFKIASSGTPGPVFIETPIDILYDEDLVREWYLDKSGVKKSEKFFSKIVAWYLERHINHMFGCELSEEELKENLNGTIQEIKKEEKEFKEILNHLEEINSEKIDLDELNNILELLTKSKKPVLVLGSQITLHPKKLSLVQEALINLNIPTYLSSMSRGLLTTENGPYYRYNRSKALKSADLVILMGVPMDFRLNYGRSINEHAKLITINLDKEDVKKNRKPDIGINDDPTKYLLGMYQNYSKMSNKDQLKWQDWIQTLEQSELEKRNDIIDRMNRETEQVNPLFLLNQIENYIKKDSVIVVDGGDFAATAAYVLEPKTPLHWLDPGPFGTLGVGAGFAIASKIIYPKEDVWIIYGDGASGYSLIEFDSYNRHNTPIIAVIGNDGSWAQIARDQVELLGDDVGTVLFQSKYEKIADAFEAKGFIIHNNREVDDVLRKAYTEYKKGNSVMINVILSPSDFRKGSISM